MKSSATKINPIAAPEIMEGLGTSEYFAVSADNVTDSATVFDETGDITPRPVPGYPALRYVPYGCDDRMPYNILRTVASDEVMSENIFFNALTLYGAGVEYHDRATDTPTDNPAVRRFAMANSLKVFFMEQCTDMKHFFFAVAVVILNREGSRIVQIRHKEACHCRFEPAGKDGKLHRLYYGNFRRPTALTRQSVEVLDILDESDPLGHLEVLMGRRPGRDGKCRERTQARKFAILMKYPTPGNRYYPSPYYLALFRGDWFDIKRLISKGKKAKIRNQGSVKYHIEIHKQYWENLFNEEGIVDPVKRRLRRRLELKKISDFALGLDNSGKTWISSYYIDSYGKEQRMIRILNVDTGKEGGDWAEDTQEASNMICYGTNIHPNLVGAVPGKASANTSGSDKRELFTLKQALEISFRDLLLRVHEVVIFFNGWENIVKPVAPMILLTTLDRHTDAVKTDQQGEELTE